ncbi:MAG: hypothetical protein ACRC3Z_00085 [Phocaeicola sp.]
MKKILVGLAMLFAVALSAHAQFEKDTWYVNTSLTGLELTHSKAEGTRFGLHASGGGFLMDNLALLVTFKGDYVKHGVNETMLGTQMRYYFSQNGIYGGMGVAYKHLSINGVKDNLVCFTPEVGYAFFLNKNLTLEPAVYYDLSLNDFSNYSKLGFKLGFGYYF